MGKRAPIRILPGAGYLRSILDYDAEIGSLIWRLRPDNSKENRNFNAIHAGKIAGCVSGNSERGNQYMVVGISVDGVYHQYKAHRVIWKMMTGKEPPDFIDHEDGDQLNLRWINLRAATNGQNIQNAKLRTDNVSGVKGVSWDSGHQKWAAHVPKDKRQFKIGRFDTIEAAAAAVNAARLKLHGNFARMV